MLVRQRIRLETGELQAPAKPSKTKAIANQFLLILTRARKNQNIMLFCVSKTRKNVSKKRNKFSKQVKTKMWNPGSECCLRFRPKNKTNKHLKNTTKNKSQKKAISNGVSALKTG